MRTYDQTLLREKVSQSHSFEELMRKMGLGVCTHTRKSLKREALKFGIDISHFDSSFSNKKRSLWKRVTKNCLACGKPFETKNDKKESDCCSRACSNGLRRGQKFTEERKNKISLALRGHGWTPKRELDEVEKRVIRSARVRIERVPSFPRTRVYVNECNFCGRKRVRKYKSKFCSGCCASKSKWTEPSYRERATNTIRESVKNGTHKGWATRNVLSYPEKFFKKVLELNGFRDKFSVNHPVSKSSIGLEGSCSFFLDFYFPNLKIDLEIDGKQHNLPDRKAHDAIRDAALSKHGYKVIRFKWKNINGNQDYFREEIKKLLEILNGDNFRGVAQN
jgi:very-short-patch-repair endonuclease